MHVEEDGHSCALLAQCVFEVMELFSRLRGIVESKEVFID